MSKKPFYIDDRLILRQAINLQDKRALTILYFNYYAKVRSYVERHISSAADAEDLAQDVFARLCIGHDHYDCGTNVE